jgi:hypothetical protein
MPSVGREILRGLLAFVFFSCMVLIMLAVQVNNDNRSLALSVHLQRSLHDYMLDGPRLNIPSKMVDWVLSALVVMSVVCHLIFVKPGIRFLLTARRFFWLLGIAYGLRALSMAGTILPPSDSSCHYQYTSPMDFVLLLPRVLLGENISCSDQLFSGHTILATLLACFWWNLSSSWLLRCYAILHESAIIFCSLGARQHYTVDIVVALIVGVAAFHLYHLLVRIVCIGELSRRKTVLPVKESDGPQEVEKVLSKYPARAVRTTIRFMDGIDLRDVGVLLTW